MSYISLKERRPSMAERRPSMAGSFRPTLIPQLAYLELPPPNVTPEEADVLIVGTGVVESVLLSALAWNGSTVVHIDLNPFYGDSSATLTVEQLKEWVQNVNEKKIGYKNFKNASLYIPSSSQHKIVSRDYGIDISPKIMFAKSDILSLLLKSKVYKYLDFQALSSFHVFENDNFEKLSNSKEDIFLNQSIDLKSKRSLMKFIKFVLDWENNKEIWENYKLKSIIEFLTQVFKLNQTQSNEIIFSLGLCTSSKLKTPDALHRIKRYLISIDVYGSFPVLYSKFGGPGEISQGFCRSSAVAGTTFKLDTNIISYDTASKVVTLSDNTALKVNEKIVFSPTQTPDFMDEYYNHIKGDSIFEVNRMVAIVTKDCKEWVGENESAGIVVFPEGSLPLNNKYAVQVVVMTSGTEVCPENQAVWYLSTIETGLKATEDLENALKLLENSIIRESNIDNITPEDFVGGASVKLGSSSLIDFIPKEKLNYILKLSYTQFTTLPHLGTVSAKVIEKTILAKKTALYDKLSEKFLFNAMPSSEISYDGVITEAKVLYGKITGSDDDFFDVDFEDEDEDNGKQIEDTAIESDED